MKAISKFILGSLSALFLFSACGKYEGGPGFSLATKKGRLSGTWEASSIEYSNGNVITIDPGTIVLTFEKDGAYTSNYIGFSSNGTWEFNDDKTAITTTINGSVNTTDPIYRLTNKDLWFKDADGDINKYSKK